MKRSGKTEGNVICQHFEDDANQLSCAMPQGIVVILTLRTLGIIETAEHVVVADDVVSGIDESVAKDRGTAFGHSGMAGIEIAGLVNRRIQSRKGQQFGR